MNQLLPVKSNSHEKGLSQKNVQSIAFTFVSQFGANFEIKFRIVY